MIHCSTFRSKCLDVSLIYFFDDRISTEFNLPVSSTQQGRVAWTVESLGIVGRDLLDWPSSRRLSSFLNHNYAWAPFVQFCTLDTRYYEFEYVERHERSNYGLHVGRCTITLAFTALYDELYYCVRPFRCPFHSFIF